MLFWRRDGEELHEDVDHGEILHNHDGTFQKSVDLHVSSVKAEDWGRYSCVFQLSGVHEDIVTKLDPKVIKTNRGVHTFQVMDGCEWDDDTGVTKGFRQYGYDGEDFIAFDLKTLTWIAPIPQAFFTKQSWDDDRAWVAQTQNYLSNICIDWLKKYVNYGRSTLLRTELPSVSLLQKTPSSPVTCHASGFYPNKIMLFWRRDGEELHEDVDHGEILHNHDGTFQKSVDLDVSSVKAEDWGRYSCVFQLSGVNEDIVTKLDPEVIKTNRAPGSPSEFPTGAVVGAVVGLLALAICITAVIIWKKRNNGFQRAKTSDSSDGSASSVEAAPLN
ncbi:BOLA class I histocompatibility antigen, alpha chain BL3-6-like [Myripristis murdjan]|uniref:BOLA class I histocompatibility antigen, alpha chain BL3-6-like n=1 Tax=Myripristis murdjan TaxID=586833 RepID=UPI0011761250|nr:BOLA class I histocompatibility antigen, alpha chain BL3-6-like [Myripristis murdjan]